MILFIFMDVAKDVFIRIFSTVNHRILNDPISLYTQKFSQMLYPKDTKLKNRFEFVAGATATLYMQKKLMSIYIVYDSVIFGIKFDQYITLSGFNTKLFAKACEELPISSGDCRFFFETSVEFPIYGLQSADIDEIPSKIEIFPFLDFEHICFFTARIPGKYTKSQNSSNQPFSAQGSYNSFSHQSIPQKESQHATEVATKSAQNDYDDEEEEFIQPGQRPRSINELEEEDVVDVFECPRTLTYFHENEEEEQYVPYVYKEQTQPTPEGVFTRYLSSSSDSSVPSSLIEYQSKNSK